MPASRSHGLWVAAVLAALAALLGAFACFDHAGGNRPSSGAMDSGGEVRAHEHAVESNGDD